MKSNLPINLDIKNYFIQDIDKSKLLNKIEWNKWYCSKYLHSNYWNKLKEIITIEAGGRCVKCSKGSTLHVHHFNYKHLGCESRDDVIVVCNDCHLLFHPQKIKKKREPFKLYKVIKKKRKSSRKKTTHKEPALIKKIKHNTSKIKITKDYLNSTCQIEQGEKTCRYISLSKIGYVCMKGSPAKEKLDELVKEEKMKARSDNCEGLNISQKIKKGI